MTYKTYMEEKNVVDYSPLLQWILTVSDRDRLLAELEQLDRELFTINTPFEEALETIFSYAEKMAFLEILRARRVESSDLVKVRDVIEAVKSYLSGLPVLGITCAFNPGEKLLKQVQLSVSDETHQPLIIAVTINPEILGGAKIEWTGKYQDYSLGKKVDEYFKGGKSQ